MTRMRRNALLMVAGMATLPVPAAAQSVWLRFTPSPGLRVHTVWNFDVQSTLGERGSTVLSIEGAGARSLTYRVVEYGPQTALVEVTADSMRFRWRPVGAPWQTVADTGGVRPTMRIRVDERLRAPEQVAAGQFPPRLRTALLAFAGGFESVLPEQAVQTGSEWSGDVVFPWSEPTGLEGEPQIGEWIGRAGPMIARMTFRVDSVVDRGADTLAFVAFDGPFVPATMAPAGERAEGSARVTGAAAGKFIWSTGWQTWVSGSLAYTIRMEVRKGVSPDEEAAYTIENRVESRLQVRP